MAEDKFDTIIVGGGIAGVKHNQKFQIQIR